jgi:hypothetical protein
MILMGENPIRGPLEGVGPENQDFFGPEMDMSDASAISGLKEVKLSLFSLYMCIYFTDK